jgi:hypothetical protein
VNESDVDPETTTGTETVPGFAPMRWSRTTPARSTTVRASVDDFVKRRLAYRVPEPASTS